MKLDQYLKWQGLVATGGEAKQGEASGWLEQLRRQAAAVVLYGAARQASRSPGLTKVVLMPKRASV